MELSLNSSLQTGITVFENDFHHVYEGTVRARARERTVNGDCNALGQLVPISSHK